MISSLFEPIPGFRFGGVAAGIKAEGLDLGAIVADRSSRAAGVFTKNLVCAAPVHLAKDAVSSGSLRSVLVNSGNANAATGDAGTRDASRLLDGFADALNDSLTRADIAPCSTGVIGVPLPVTTIEAAFPALVADLTMDGAERFAHAILTTDRSPKAARRTLTHGQKEYSVLAIAKGAGMIHPNMATTLAFVLTDAPVDGFSRMLVEATDATFNRITVDGDTSTNDTILAMASGTGDMPGGFGSALREVLGAVAEMIVADGEGAEHVAEIVVDGAGSDSDALQIARTVATSNLVKTAMHGCDPNWGRIAAAAGRAGIPLNAASLRVSIGGIVLFENGASAMTHVVEERAAEVMKRPRYTIRVDVGTGSGKGRYLTCDLGHGYVSVNADYRS